MSSPDLKLMPERVVWCNFCAVKGVMPDGHQGVELRWSLMPSTTNLTKSPIAKTEMDRSALLARYEQGDLLRNIAQAVLQLIIEADLNGLIGAGRRERNGERKTCPIG